MIGKARRGLLSTTVLSLVKSRYFFISEKNSSCYGLISSKIVVLCLILVFISLGGMIRGVLYVLLSAQNIISVQIEKKKYIQYDSGARILDIHLSRTINDLRRRSFQPVENKDGSVCGVYKTGLEIIENNKTLIQNFNCIFPFSQRLQPAVFDRPLFKGSNFPERLSFLSPAEGRITSHFGMRTDPVYEGTARHNGIDIAGKLWTPVYSSLAGTVIFAGNRSRWGNVVIIDHAETGYQTIYAHLQKINTRGGDEVKTGQLIGFLGNTGKSTGPHLHYEVRFMAKPINPLQVLIPFDTVVD